MEYKRDGKDIVVDNITYKSQYSIFDVEFFGIEHSPIIREDIVVVANKVSQHRLCHKNEGGYSLSSETNEGLIILYF